ncbi:MAG: fibronectin type III domain-containing protein, partial [Chitinispirillaceae bacterium]|nr:fibronectin type III domain-containing protein [Chitinispirillaceae bacterium]
MTSAVRWSVAVSFILFSVLQAMAQYSVTLPHKQVTVETVKGTAVFSGASVAGAPGKPSLPHYLVSFILPPDVDFNDVEISLVNPVDREVAGTSFVHPCEPPRDERGNLVWPKKLVDGKDMTVYGKNDFFPAAYKGNASFGKMRQYKIVDISINPYRWNPVTGKMRVITGGTLMVTVPKSVLSTRDSVRDLPRCAWAERLLGQKVVNLSEVQYYGAAPAETVPLQTKSTTSDASSLGIPITGSYAIITTNKILNYSMNINYYINDLSVQGFQVMVLTENQYGTGATADACANLVRQWLRANYLTQNIQYVLLVGDPNPAAANLPDVPMKLVTIGNEYPSCPTDFYFSELSGSNGIVDQHGEVIVGRIPVYPAPGGSSPNIGDLNKILGKTMSYKNAIDIEWRRAALLPIVPLFRNQPNSDYSVGEDIVNDILKPAQWEHRRLYDPYNYTMVDVLDDVYHFFVEGVVNMSELPEQPYCNYELVKETWKSFKPGIVTWYTHGWEHGAVDIIHHGTAAELDDQYPAIVFANSCMTMKPEDASNLGFVTVLNNAVAYIGGTRNLYRDHVNMKFFTERLVTQGMSVGEALSGMRANWFPFEEGISIGYLYSYNLYGCPEVALNLEPYGLAATPGNFSVQAVSSSRIDLSWSGVDNALYYVVERGDENATRENGFSFAAQVWAPNTSYQDAGLLTGTKYKYRVYASGPGPRSGCTHIDSASTLDGTGQSKAPPVPVSIIASSYDNSADLTWSPGSGPAAESYNIKRSLNRMGPYVTVGNATGTSFRCENLINGTTYYFVVSAVNYYGQSGVSNYCVAEPQPHPIAVPPSNFNVASADPSTLTFTWTDNSDNELFFDLEYTASYNYLGEPRVDNGFKRIKRNLEPTGQTALTGFENNTIVTCRIRAGNEYGVSPYSQSCQGSTTAGTPPGVPVGFAGSAPSPVQINLSWAPASSGYPTSGYQICWKKDGPGEIYALIDQELPAATTNLTFGTSEQTTVLFIIRAYHIDAGGSYSYSSFSSPISVTTPAYSLGMPGSFHPGVTSSSRILLTWQDNSDETEFIIERTNSEGNFVVLARPSANTTSYLDEQGISEGNTYSYRMRAYNASKPYPYSRYTDEKTVTVQAPHPAPAMKSIEAVSSTSIRVAWTESVGATEYRLERSLTGETDDFDEIARPAGDIEEYVDNTLSPGTTYYYQVSAYNALGSSGWSMAVSATTPEEQCGPSIVVAGDLLVNLMAKDLASGALSSWGNT